MTHDTAYHFQKIAYLQWTMENAIKIVHISYVLNLIEELENKRWWIHFLDRRIRWTLCTGDALKTERGRNVRYGKN